MHFSRERAILLAVATTLFGCASLTRKLAIDRMPPLQYQYQSSLVYALTVPVFYLLASRYESSYERNAVGTFWMFVATVIGIVANVLFGYALRASEDVGVTTALSSASPVITMMLAFLFLGEKPSLQAGVGCALVLIGVIPGQRRKAAMRS